MKHCNKCGHTKPRSDFYRSVAKADGLNSCCKSCSLAASYDWRNTIPGRAKAMMATSRRRARELKVPFELTEAWYTQRLTAGVCEVTGLPLELSAAAGQDDIHQRPWTPSTDRTDPTRGYTPDNVKMVCCIYNQAKGRATHADVVRFAKAVAHG